MKANAVPKFKIMMDKHGKPTAVLMDGVSLPCQSISYSYAVGGVPCMTISIPTYDLDIEKVHSDKSEFDKAVDEMVAENKQKKAARARGARRVREAAANSDEDFRPMREFAEQLSAHRKGLQMTLHKISALSNVDIIAVGRVDIGQLQELSGEQWDALQAAYEYDIPASIRKAYAGMPAKTEKAKRSKTLPVDESVITAVKASKIALSVLGQDLAGNKQYFYTVANKKRMRPSLVQPLADKLGLSLGIVQGVIKVLK